MSELKQKAVSGMLWSSVQRFGTLGISFISNLVLARLLFPEDYGALGMIMVFVTIANVFVDSGFGNALIQKSNPTEVDYSTVFYFNLIASLFLYAVLYFSAPYIADFYDMTSLCSLLRVISLVLIINSFSIIQTNLLRKQLDFKRMSVVSIISYSVSAAIGIYMAYNGYGVWSLVVNNLSAALIQAILLWILCHWHPSLVFSFKSLKELFAFGGFLLANSLLVTIRRNILAFIIGKLYSSRDLGFYSQAKKLEEVPVTSLSAIIGQVTFPVFSAVQNDTNQLKSIQQKSFLSISFISLPLMLLLMVIAKSLILLLFSDKWVESVPYFQLLCLSGIFVSISEVNANVVNSLGHSKLFFKWSIIKTCILFLLIFLGSLLGIYGLLGGLIVLNILEYSINASLASRYTHYKLSKQILDILPFGILSLICAAISYFSTYYFDINYIIEMCIQVSVFIFLYLCALVLFKFSAYDSYKKQLKNMVGRIFKMK